MNCIPLSEGVFTIGHDKIFKPFQPGTDVLTDRPTGSLLVEIQPFLVQVRNHNILFDTGLGFQMPSGAYQIHANLLQHGLQPEDIDMVLVSHLHKDHAGGLLQAHANGIDSLMFPVATYYISAEEFRYAEEKGSPSYITEDFLLLKNHPQIEWLDTEGVLDGLIYYHTSGGHCPHHLCFLLDDGQEKVFFGGDVAPQMKQLKTKYVAKYDYDGRKSMEQRQHYATQGAAEGWKFLFYHDVHLPIGTLPGNNNG
jgi:glyoxylase-like metal-dependent hydrolase (beta-lactamase superfamily II)